MKSVRWFVATLLVGALAACNSFVDLSDPEVYVNVGPGAAVPNEFELTAIGVDVESGIKRLEVTFGGAMLGILIVPDDERTNQPVTVSGTVSGVVPGASYLVTATAVNGVGAESVVSVVVQGAADPAD